MKVEIIKRCESNDVLALSLKGATKDDVRAAAEKKVEELSKADYVKGCRVKDVIYAGGTQLATISITTRFAKADFGEYDLPDEVAESLISVGCAVAVKK